MNRRFTVFVMFSFALFLFAGLAFGQGRGQTGQDQKKLPPFVEETNIPDGKAVLYVYRPGDLPPVGWLKASPLIILGNELVGTLTNAGYLVCFVDPGNVKLWIVSTSSKSLKMDFVAGQIYYVKGGFGYSLLPQYWDMSLSQVPREAGKTEISKCERIPD